MGMGELIVVLVVVVLIFGANKIPALGDGLGKAIRNFRKSMKDDDAIDVTPKAPAPPAPPPAAPPPGQPPEPPGGTS
jgi:sec-independent protein translocase protein TatA